MTECHEDFVVRVSNAGAVQDAKRSGRQATYKMEWIGEPNCLTIRLFRATVFIVSVH